MPLSFARVTKPPGEENSLRRPKDRSEANPDRGRDAYCYAPPAQTGRAAFPHPGSNAVLTYCSDFNCSPFGIAAGFHPVTNSGE
jgi:hypothetical protein